MLPCARRDGLLVHELGDELVVYDEERHRAHNLNRTAALIWQQCDGQTTIEDMVLLLRTQLNFPADEKFVWLTLNRLEKARLLQERLTPPMGMVGMSRRDMVRKMASTGASLFLLPLVLSIVVPPPQAAATGGGGGGSCATHTGGNCSSYGGCAAPSHCVGDNSCYCGGF